MSWKTNLASIALASAAAVVVAQAPPAGSTSTTKTTQTTTQNPDGTSTTSTRTVTVTGEVMQYEPGHTIVIREPNKEPVTYTLDSGLTVPSDIQVGRRVMIYTEPADGSVRVARITTVTAPMPETDSNPQAMSSSQTTSSPQATTSSSQTTSSPQATTSRSQQSKTTTTTSASGTDSGAPPQTMQTTTTRATSISGTVQAYEPGQSITVVGPNSKTTTYTITTDSQLPKDVAVGKQVTVQTTVVSGKPVVRSVQYKTTTKTVHTKTVSPQ
ncbi:MAG: hypothetical protein LC796_03785 [Acidobacteria bacterium]|nr:hypothetical protein [Acidobacteriota bacterium]MCA1611541.1 hypothetical protein [Acidobacteriota bacterium]